MQKKTFIETGVTFHVIDAGLDFHSFHDLRLVLAPFVLPPAIPKINLLDIEGMDGSLDLTEANGEINYYDRDLKFTFSVFPGDDMTFEERQTAISNALNGRRCKITLDKEPDYYFIGRCMVNEHLCDKKLCQVVITATVAPYKLRQHETVTTFEFPEAYEIRTIVLTNGRKRVVPTIETSGEVHVEFGTYKHLYKNETVKDLNIYLSEGANLMTIQGLTNASTIKFSYQEGDL